MVVSVDHSIRTIRYYLLRVSVVLHAETRRRLEKTGQFILFGQSYSAYIPLWLYLIRFILNRRNLDYHHNDTSLKRSSQNLNVPRKTRKNPRLLNHMRYMASNEAERLCGIRKQTGLDENSAGQLDLLLLCHMRRPDAGHGRDGQECDGDVRDQILRVPGVDHDHGRGRCMHLAHFGTE